MPDKSNWDSSTPLIIAHRGASRLAPENTIAAFNLAVELGADAVELDAMLTADGIPVVIHDQTLERSTNGSGKVSSKTAKEICRLNSVAQAYSEYSGEKVPTLEEVFIAVGRKILINVEIKNLSSPFDNLVETVIGLVQDMDLSRRVLLSSFNPLALIQAKRISPEIRRAALIGGGPRIIRGFMEMATDYSALHPEVSLVSQNLINKHHASGRIVNVWTVNDEVEMMRLLAMGVDGLITDVPKMARKVIESRLRKTGYGVG